MPFIFHHAVPHVQSPNPFLDADGAPADTDGVPFPTPPTLDSPHLPEQSDLPMSTLNEFLSLDKAPDDFPFDPALLDDFDDINGITPPSTASSVPSHIMTDTSDEQLVNDTNRIGPGHDIMVRPFVCGLAQCNKAFARKSDLARHFRIHTNERPFHCLHRGCGKSFIQRSALTVHIRTHTGERPHVCEACEKTFADSSSLARHRRIHTGKRPYACRVDGCDRSFARKITYGKHYRSAHPDEPPLSNETSKPTVPMPLYTITRGPVIQPGPPNAEGVPQYWITTPADTPSTPHAYAVPHPSEGPAYHEGGKRSKPRAKSSTAVSRAKQQQQQRGRSSSARAQGQGQGQRQGKGKRPGDVDATGGGGTGGGSGGGSEFYISPAETEQTTSIGTPLSSAASELHEIYSACASVHTPEPNVPVDKPSADFTWSTTFTATPSSGHDSIVDGYVPGAGAGSTHPGSILTSTALPAIPEGGASPLDLGPSQHPTGLDSAQSVHLSYEPTPFTDYVQHRFAPVFPRSDDGQVVQLRAASNPERPRHVFDLYGGVGGGFSSNQVSMPPGMLQPIDTRNDRSVSAPMSRQQTRNGSPPLVAINTVPDFSFQPPTGPAVHMPYSAVEGYPNPLTHAPPQLLSSPVETARLHSAPPHLQRFNSLPSIPTMSTLDTTPMSTTSSVFSPHPAVEPMEDSWINLDAPVVQTSPVQPDPSQPGQHRDVTAVSPVVPSPAIATPAIPALLTTEPLRRPMGTPSVKYPTPPHHHILQRNPFANSGANSQYATPTACSPAMFEQPAQFQLAPQPPMFTPYQPQQPHHPHYFASSVTPNPLWQGYRSHSQPVSALGSPVVLATPGFSQPGSRLVSGATDLSVQNVLLTTPPRHAPAHLESVNNVGLGISNVHFDESRSVLHTPAEQLQYPAGVSGEMQLDEPYVEGEPELDNLDDFIVTEDSDDEFVPGKKQQKKKKAKTKKRGSIKVSRKTK